LKKLEENFGVNLAFLLAFIRNKSGRDAMSMIIFETGIRIRWK